MIDSTKLRSSVARKTQAPQTTHEATSSNPHPRIKPTETQEIEKGKRVIGPKSIGPYYKCGKSIGPYYKCGLYGHLSAACRKNNPTRANYIEQEEDLEESENDELEEGSEKEMEAINVEGDQGDHYLAIRRVLTTKSDSKEKWLRRNIFRTTCTVHGLKLRNKARLCAIFLWSASKPTQYMLDVRRTPHLV